MKTLILMRHASATNSYIINFMRRLAPRALKECEKAGKFLQQVFDEEQFDKINNALIRAYISPAYRTIETMMLILEYKEINFNIKEEIYRLDMSGMINFIKNLDNKLLVVMILGHNPTISQVAHTISSNYQEYEKLIGELFAPASIAVIKFDNISSWKEISSNGRIHSIFTPRIFNVD